MREFLRFFWRFGRKLLEKELASPAGKMNLVGGIFVAVLVALIITHDLLTVLLNSVLSLLGKPLLPPVSEFLVGAGLLFLLMYFYFSVKVTKDE